MKVEKFIKIRATIAVELLGLQHLPDGEWLQIGVEDWCTYTYEMVKDYSKPEGHYNVTRLNLGKYTHFWGLNAKGYINAVVYFKKDESLEYCVKNGDRQHITKLVLDELRWNFHVFTERYPVFFDTVHNCNLY